MTVPDAPLTERPAAMAARTSAERRAYLAATHDIEGYVDACRLAHERAPGNGNLAVEYAEILGHLGRAADKRTLLDKVLAAEPDHALARVALGLELMSVGLYREAWPHYAHRLKMRRVITEDRALDDKRRWRGERLDGRGILLIPEQGLGDTIQFFRYALTLTRHGARPFLNVQPALRETLAGSPALGTVLKPDKSVDVHYWVRALDLVPVFTPTYDDVTWPGSYVGTPADRAPFNLGDGRRRLRVGLAWRGSPANGNDPFRSLPLSALAPLRETPHARFFSLLPTESDGRRPVPDDCAWITDLSATAQPFLNLARAVAAMDVVLTVCTSIAHLAGAMGKPTLLLLSVFPDWRWGRNGARTRWYPSMTIIRQSRLGDWATPVGQATAHLSQF